MSVKCEESINELTVKIRLLYHQPNVKYCILFASGTELLTDGQPTGQADEWTIQLLDAPGGPFRLGHKNDKPCNIVYSNSPRVINQSNLSPCYFAACHFFIS